MCRELMANAQNKWETAHTCNITTEIATFSQRQLGQRGALRRQSSLKTANDEGQKSTHRNRWRAQKMYMWKPENKTVATSRDGSVTQSISSRLGYLLPILVLLLLLHFYSQPLNLCVVHIDLPDKMYNATLGSNSICATDFMHVRRRAKVASAVGGDRDGSSFEAASV